MTSSDADSQSGFSLIETMVAMAILAVAAAGLIGAAEMHVRRIDGLEARAAALWVAENHLAEMRVAGGAATLDPATVTMLGEQWRIETRREETEDPSLISVTIEVARASEQAVFATLTGFVDIGAMPDRQEP